MNCTILSPCERCPKDAPKYARVRVWINTRDGVPLGVYDVCRDCLIAIEIENAMRNIQTKWLDQEFQQMEEWRVPEISDTGAL